MHLAELFSPCDDVSQSGWSISGIYNINVQGRNGSVPVYCELNTYGGNWLVSYFIVAGLITNVFFYFIRIIL